MKMLVIPDIHLKPWIFDLAKKAYKEQGCDKMVCVGDIVDDWNQEYNVDLYINTMDKMLEMAREFPETLWCYGNHDVCYIWRDAFDTGYAEQMENIVSRGLYKLKEAAGDNLGFIHKVDRTIFSHAGVMKSYVERYFNPEEMDIDSVVEGINNQGYNELWPRNYVEDTPLWARPQMDPSHRPFDTDCLQVVGHTPVQTIYEQNGVLTVDTFSTDSIGNQIGERAFAIVDTVKASWEKLYV